MLVSKAGPYCAWMTAVLIFTTDRKSFCLINKRTCQKRCHNKQNKQQNTVNELDGPEQKPEQQHNRYSAQATAWMTEEFWFDSGEEQEILLFSKAPRPVLEPTLPPIQYVPGAGFPEVS